VSGDVFTKWEEREELDLKRRKERRSELAGGQVERGKGRAHVRNTSKSSIVEVSKGKGKGAGNGSGVDMEDEDNQQVGEQVDSGAQQDLGPLVVLACRHIYHETCLEAMQVEEAVAPDGREFRCPIDG
jgi:hypothetical protein